MRLPVDDRSNPIGSGGWIDGSGLLDRLRHGIVLHGADLEVCFVNRFARELLSRSRCVRLMDRRLRPNDPSARARYERMLAAAARGESGTLLMRSAAEPTMILLAVPCGDAQTGCRVAVILSPCDAAERTGSALVERLSRLTAAETSVLEALLRDGSPERIAYERGVSVRTVRAQLSSIYAKTGVAGQRELLALVSSVPPFASS